MAMSRGGRQQRRRLCNIVTRSSWSMDVASRPAPIRIILADSEAIFRVGMSKIFACKTIWKSWRKPKPWRRR